MRITFSYKIRLLKKKEDYFNFRQKEANLRLLFHKLI